MEKHLFSMLQDIQREWGLTHDQMAALLHVERARYEAWLGQIADPKAAEALPTVPSGAESAVPLVAIHRRLGQKLPEAEKQVQWLTTGHPDFDGNRPYDVALSSPENLAWIAYYLESAMAGMTGASSGR